MSSRSPEQAVAPSEAIVNKIAHRDGVDPLELPPLYEAIDPDALDVLIETGPRTESALHLKFTYNGYEVAVSGDGVVHLDEEATPRRTRA